MKVSVFGIGAGAAGLAYGSYDTNSVSIRHDRLYVPHWNAKDFTVGFFSDTHLSDGDSVMRTSRTLEQLISMNPDMILFGGDFVESSIVDSPDQMKAGLAPARHTRIPLYAVLGNHDYAVPRPARVRQEAERAGFDVLANEVRQIGPITLAGLDCMSFGMGRPEIVESLASEPSLLVAVHEPDTASRIRHRKGAVMLAGHSHGGQVCLPGGIPLRTPPLAHKYISGYYPDAPVPVFVSKGVGVTEVPFRLFCRAEASFVTITGKKG